MYFVICNDIGLKHFFFFLEHRNGGYCRNKHFFYKTNIHCNIFNIIRFLSSSAEENKVRYLTKNYNNK